MVRAPRSNGKEGCPARKGCLDTPTVATLKGLFSAAEEAGDAQRKTSVVMP